MQENNDLRRILKEVSAAISESLSSPAIMQKLELLKDKGYQLYLIMESADETGVEKTPGPVMPIQVSKEGGGRKPSVQRERRTDMFDLSKDDKDFLRTLKIRVD